MAVNLIDSNDIKVEQTGQDIELNLVNPIPVVDSVVSTSSTNPIENQAITNYVNNNIVESGSNSNGKYVKYVDGTMICYGTKSGSTTWGDYWNFAKRSPDGTDALSITLPEEFYDTNYSLSITPQYGYTAVYTVMAYTKTTSNFTFVCLKPSASSDTGYYVDWIATGRWKA